MAAGSQPTATASNSKRQFFTSPNILWWLFPLGGMVLLYIVAFHPHLVPFDSLGFVGTFLRAVSTYRVLAQFVFVSAVVIHLYESWVAWSICQELNVSTADRAKWVAQTMLLGFPSLRYLVWEKRRVKQQH